MLKERMLTDGLVVGASPHDRRQVARERPCERDGVCVLECDAHCVGLVERGGEVAPVVVVHENPQDAAERVICIRCMGGERGQLRLGER